MFKLSVEEWEHLISQFATSSWGGTRKLPYVFTEHGILQLSNVLKKIILSLNLSILFLLQILKKPEFRLKGTGL